MKRFYVSLGLMALFSLTLTAETHASRIGSSTEMLLKTPMRVTAGNYFSIQLDAKYRLDMRCTDTSLNSDSFGKVFFLKSGKATRKMVFTKTGQQTLHFECSPKGSPYDVWYAGKRIYVAN